MEDKELFSFGENLLPTSTNRGRTVHNIVAECPFTLRTSYTRSLSWSVNCATDVLEEGEDYSATFNKKDGMLEFSFLRACKGRQFFLVKIFDSQKEPLFEFMVNVIRSHEAVEIMRKEQGTVAKGQKKKTLNMSLPRTY
eukprot:TRINITY_DN14573_c0_g1_i1.p2 TRINITY_DN14573_c0_g1~~TRINITY_DN14573_c0_g1_i1.p2  ORF type:complete len:139 (-),score=19.36 TRINITY_DN14573_c0_g1_i1:575-991(-)